MSHFLSPDGLYLATVQSIKTEYKVALMKNFQMLGATVVSQMCDVCSPGNLLHAVQMRLLQFCLYYLLDSD